MMFGSRHRTLRRPVTVSGIGIHRGESVTVTFRPDGAGPGIRFRRVDLEGAPEIPADLDHIACTELGTTIEASPGESVQTVEHLMAALAAAGISRVVAEIDGPEAPILDGSFEGYLAPLREAGVVELDDPLPVLSPPRPLSLDGEDGDQSYVALPHPSLHISATIQFDHPAIGRQYGSFAFGEGGFETEIARARTFGFAAEAEMLRERGLACGASLENTVVLGEEGILNDGLRYPDEFLRHKVGDLVGDLALLGARIDAHIIAERPSHRGNIALARALAREGRRNAARAPVLDISQILEYLPHRYPMLLVDRIIDFESGKRITGVKNVTINEPFFQGHYPGHPIMPGVLIVEAMAQVGGLLLIDAIEDPENKVVYFMSLDRVKWRRPVRPGDQLIFELRLTHLRRSICKMRGEGFVDGRLVAEAELMARVMER